MSLAVSGVERLRAEGAAGGRVCLRHAQHLRIAGYTGALPKLQFYGTFPPLETYALRGEEYLVVATRGTAAAMNGA